MIEVPKHQEFPISRQHQGWFGSWFAFCSLRAGKEALHARAAHKAESEPRQKRGVVWDLLDHHLPGAAFSPWWRVCEPLAGHLSEERL